MIEQLSPLVVASRNAKKVREIADLLIRLDIELLDLSKFPDAPEVAETGTTFAENAALKASETALATRHWTLADDSGLEVDALRGDPGVYSARYAGLGCTDAENNEKLLQALRGLPPEKRGAQFVCNLAVADPAGTIRLQVQAHCRGRIIEDLNGTEGFGYDPLFLIPEYHRTFGQLGLAVKSCLSHRSRAFRQLAAEFKRPSRASSCC